VSDEFVGYSDIDVAFQQGFANFGQACVEVFAGELSLAAEILEGALEFVVRVSNMLILGHGHRYWDR